MSVMTITYSNLSFLIKFERQLMQKVSTEGSFEVIIPFTRMLLASPHSISTLERLV